MHLRTLVKSEVALTFWAVLLNVVGAVLITFALLSLFPFGPTVNPFPLIAAGGASLIVSAVLRGFADVIILLRRNSGFAFPAGRGPTDRDHDAQDLRH